jgi:hypothetical protein
MYRRRGIRWKSMRLGYPHSEMKLAEIDSKRRESFSALIQLVAQGKKVLYCDEISFSAYGTSAKSWARVGENQILTKGALRLPTLYAMVVISGEAGLEGFYMSESPIVISDSLQLLWNMKNFYQPHETVLFWDNLRGHHSREVLALVASFNWQVLFNAPYSSAWHCIETAFA